MTVSVDYNGNKYNYIRDGDFAVWKDCRDLAVPVMLHEILKEKAIADGADPKLFLTKKIIHMEKPRKVVSVRKKKSKTNKKCLSGGFNPFR